MSELNGGNTKANACINILTDQNAFYDALQIAVCNSKSEVLFIHLDPYVATKKDRGDDGRGNYFDAAHEYIRTHSITMKRIISIPNERKLEWTKDLIEKTKEIDTLDLAYIKIEDIEKSFPETVISCDIIDGHRLFLLNPTLNHIPVGKTFRRIIDIDNPEAANVYKEYFEKLWSEITKEGSKIGCYLKKGRDCSYFESNVERIKKDMMENQR